jgi:hypothetical protein
MKTTQKTPRPGPKLKKQAGAVKNDGMKVGKKPHKGKGRY